jgi:hypothetical protein
MALTKEEIAADLVWRCTEHIRVLEAEGRRVEFTREELEQLVEVLQLAARVPEALEVAEPHECREAVRRRLEQELAVPLPIPDAAPASAGVSGGAPLRDLLRRPLTPSLGYGFLAGAALAAALAFSTANLWHRPKPLVTVRRVPIEAPNVDPMDERTAHALLPQMVRSPLPPQEERNLMWHMLVCPGCFRDYVALKQQMAPQLSRRTGVGLAGW